MENNDKDIIYTTIARLLSAEAGPADRKLMGRWLSDDGRNSEIFDSIKAYWESPVEAVDYPGAGPGYEKLSTRIRKEGKKKRISKYLALSLASAAVVLACVVLLAYMGIYSGEVRYFTYASGNGVAEITLPDNTAVVLNRNSTLTYTSRYGSKERNVSLSGEAWLDVCSDPQHPFLLEMGEARIRVLGTKFTARYREDENIINAGLAEGTIRFEADGQSIQLNPGRQLIYDRTRGEIDIEPFDAYIEAAWKDRLIRYRGLSFDELLSLLESHYGVEINLEGTFDRYSLTGSLDTDHSIEQILDAVKNTVPYTWRREGNRYRIEAAEK